MIYVASPYTFRHSSPSYVDRVHNHRFSLVEGYTAALIRGGYVAFSPIMYCHKIAHTHNLPKEAAFWDAFNMAFLRRSSSMNVLKLQGWDTSVGVQREINIATELGLSIIYTELEDEAFPELCSA